MSSLFPRLDPSSSTLVDRRGKRSNYIYIYICIYRVYKRSLASSLRGVQDNRAANLGSLRKCCYSDSEMTFPRLWKVYRKVGRLIARFNYLGAFEEERGFVELSDSKSWSFAIIIT